MLLLDVRSVSLAPICVNGLIRSIRSKVSFQLFEEVDLQLKLFYPIIYLLKGNCCTVSIFSLGSTLSLKRPEISAAFISAGGPSEADPGPNWSKSDSTKNRDRFRFCKTGSFKYRSSFRIISPLSIFRRDEPRSRVFPLILFFTTLPIRNCTVVSFCVK